MKKTLARLILLTDVKTGSYWDNLYYFFKIVVQAAPIAYLLSWVNIWFVEHKQFFFFMCLLLIVNLIVGIWYHVRFNSFSWQDFWKKNMSMLGALIVTYFVLEMFRQTAGDNLAGDFFRVTIQLSTMLYPASKILKNIYLLTNKEHPPAWIMERLYKFEKTGKISDLVEELKEEKEEVIQN